MSDIPLLPRYFIGTYQSVQDIVAGKHRVDGTWHAHWAVDPPPADAQHVWVVLRKEEAVPHPDWIEMPHLLDPTPLKQALKDHPAAHVQTALADPVIGVAPTDNTYTVAMKMHRKLAPVFKP